MLTACLLYLKIVFEVNKKTAARTNNIYSAGWKDQRSSIDEKLAESKKQNITKCFSPLNWQAIL